MKNSAGKLSLKYQKPKERITDFRMSNMRKLASISADY